jgi:outer membrane murein-binding lipoprotein Lpp
MKHLAALPILLIMIGCSNLPPKSADKVFPMCSNLTELITDADKLAQDFKASAIDKTEEGKILLKKKAEDILESIKQSIKEF